MPCILNAANEVAVNAFLTGRIGFLQMPDVVRDAMETCSFSRETNLELLENTDNAAREAAFEYLNKL
jgi:1-deoxy-D-xylulose-5-phosphate reductoisomerase